MKKTIKGIFILILFIVMFIGANVYAATPTLEEIVNTFNNCSTVKEYSKYGSVWTASYSDNKINISLAVNGTSTNVEFILEDSILKASFSKNDSLTGLPVTVVLADTIGQLHGYSDGDLFTTLNSDKISNYSVENEGFEIKDLSDEGYQIKIDISKKIPLIDMNNEYIEVSDLESFKSYISGDGSAGLNKGNLSFNKSGYDGENIILIAEKDNLTENAYKSILSVIEVMFDSKKASNYFASNYSGMSVGDKEFTGFKIEINPTKTDWEEQLIPEDSGYEFARITVDKNSANLAINENTDTEQEENTEQENEEVVEESNEEIKENNNQASERIPQTGVNMKAVYVIIFIILIAIISCKKYYNFKDIK